MFTLYSVVAFLIIIIIIIVEELNQDLIDHLLQDIMSYVSALNQSIWKRNS